MRKLWCYGLVVGALLSSPVFAAWQMQGRGDTYYHADDRLTGSSRAWGTYWFNQWGVNARYQYTYDEQSVNWHSLEATGVYRYASWYGSVGWQGAFAADTDTTQHYLTAGISYQWQTTQSISLTYYYQLTNAQSLVELEGDYHIPSPWSNAPLYFSGRALFTPDRDPLRGLVGILYAITANINILPYVGYSTEASSQGEYQTGMRLYLWLNQ
jgi:hypothetical protein